MRRGVLALGVALLLVPLATRAQSKAEKESGRTKLRVEVTAGDKDEPVENASVYIRYTQSRFLRKAKKIEMNLKTNREGIATIRDLPQGKIMVQVVAPGWKTFGQYYTLDKPEQTIQIKLEKPPRWY